MKWPITQLTTADGTQVTAQAPYIISASRATDIPALYGEWLVERVKQGYLKWINPFSSKTVYVSFQNARLFVFWTKNPKPFLKNLDFFDQNGYNYYFQYTLNDYDNELYEPNIPPLSQRIETFILLSERIGKDKLIWRFDPLVLTTTIDIDELLKRIENIANKICRYTNKLVFSFADIGVYKKVQKNLNTLKIPYIEFDQQQMIYFAQQLSRLNQKWNLQLATCAENIDLRQYGILHNKCIDDDLIIRLFHNDQQLMNFLGVYVETPYMFNSFSYKTTKNLKDKGQRKDCGCIISKDIGQYNTCINGCVYCYAVSSLNTSLFNQ